MLTELQIVIPMAGRGKPFKEAGYTFPKPLIDINGKSMIQVVVENLNLGGSYIFICLKEHHDKYSLEYLLPMLSPGCKIITVEQPTQGAAMTALLAKEFINNDEELVIAASDQWLNWNPQHFISFLRSKNADGGIVTFISTHPRWSFAKVNDEGLVTEVAEKRPISNIATAGVYYYKKGKDFIEAAESMIRKDIRVNNEFYIAPAFNEMIGTGKKIYNYPVVEMRSIGTPEDLKRFIEMSDRKVSATEV